MTDKDLELFKEILGLEDQGFGYEYNLFCCEQAIEIASLLKSKEKIIEFHKAEYETQKQMVPTLSDDHSGNTFEMSCRIAISYLPRFIQNQRDEKIEAINS